jgi:hypothetical protein
MKKITLMLTIVCMFLFLAVPVMALEMPDLSVDGYLLYNLNTKLTTAAPGVSASLVKFADGVIEGNVGVVFPAQNDDTTKSWMAGPIVDINFVKLIDKIKGSEIVAKDLKLSGGIGVMVDVLHMSGRSIKDVIVPCMHIRFTF